MTTAREIVHGVILQQTKRTHPLEPPPPLLELSSSPDESDDDDSAGAARLGRLV